MKEYAEQWDVSAKYFYDKGYYTWMANSLKGHNNILEVGCGTGFSTLALIEEGFTVIAIDKNSECIEKAKTLLIKESIDPTKITFLEGDIANDDFRTMLIDNYEFDMVICWNIGTFWSKEMIQYYLPYMFEYGLRRAQIAENPESSYSELIIWNTCRLAKAKNVSANIVDRGAEIINKDTDPYYYTLKNEFKFKFIEYKNKIADSLSTSGRILSTNGVVNTENKIDIVFASITYR